MKAMTRWFDTPIDLNDVARGDGYLFVRSGENGPVGLAGRGVAARIPVSRVADVLASISVDDEVNEPGSGPVAVGALPFHHRAPGSHGELVIPAVTIVKDGTGRTWVTQVANSGDEFKDAADALTSTVVRPTAAAATFTVEAGTPVEVYLHCVRMARDAVRSGKLTKVVVARDIVVTSNSAIDVHAVLLRLRLAFGSSYRYSIDGFIGASPELLVSRHHDVVRSHPLAGTTARTGDPATDARLADELIASTKNQVEHRVVIDMVHDVLLPWCSYLDEEAEPSIVSVANVQHLGTAMEGRLSSPAPSALDMARALSPTPAVGGHPHAAAIAFLNDHEHLERGLYAGTVGWVDAHGNGTWAVALRCAVVNGNQARLFAGGGIVADSDPNSELAETQAKFQAMLGAIVRP